MITRRTVIAAAAGTTLALAQAPASLTLKFVPQAPLTILDPGFTAANITRAGEVDWWEQALSDLLPTLRRDRNVATDRADPTGLRAVMGFDTLQAPFDKPLMRRAMLHAVNQNDHIIPVTGGEGGTYRLCHFLFPCGAPYGKPATPDPISKRPDLDRARALTPETGYGGEKIVVSNPTDFPSISPFDQETYDTMRKLGLNAELADTDRVSVLTQRNNRAPVAQDGWSVFHSFNNGSSIFDPVCNVALRGNGEKGWAGWYGNERMEGLVQTWLAVPSAEERERVAAAVQDLAALDAPSLPIGQFYLDTAYRRSLFGITPSPTPVPWDVQRA